MINGMKPAVLEGGALLTESQERSIKCVWGMDTHSEDAKNQKYENAFGGTVCRYPFLSASEYNRLTRPQSVCNPD